MSWWSSGFPSAPAWPAARLFEFGVERETPERIAPHAFERLADRPELVTPRAIETVTSFGTQIHQAGPGQLPQVERDRTEGHVRHRRVDRPGLQLLIP